jgi:probable phosphoglycerate mutase
MDVYFVRHGQTDGNVANRHQHTGTSLNERGRAQAHAAAILVAALKPTLLISSTHKRALESAEIISEACGLIPETYLPFEELHQSKSMVGERLTGLHALLYMGQWFLGSKSASMHDGETFASFTDRLAQAQTHLEELPSDARVVVVSHSVFINFFLDHMRHRSRMGPGRAVIRFFRILLLKNSSITHVRYTTPSSPRDTGWKQIST